MKLHEKLFISFSGGETSAFMTDLIMRSIAVSFDEIVILFANTGQEDERTLTFVDRCAKHFGWPVVWVEAVVHHGIRKNPTAKVVSFETASRKGEPFEEMIKKYGIPNSKFKHCTRSLKLRPMEDYVRNVLGWLPGSYNTAIGIRSDEIDRISSQQEEKGILYPLIQMQPSTKPDVNAFWRDQPFRLGLKGYEGNCSWCWKKSFRKHYTLLGERPDIYDFPERMETEHGLIGHEFSHDPATQISPLPPGYRRTFFRENRSVKNLREEATRLPNTFAAAPDDATVYPAFDPNLDVGSGCEESCEVFADEDADDQ